MILLVDAHNVIYKFPDLEEKMYRSELAEARRGLLQKLLDLRNAWKKPMEIHVFVDGKRKSGDETRQETISDMAVYYSHDLSADYLIKQYIKQHPQTGNLLVITADKDILGHAKKYKCKSQTSDDFAKWAAGIIANVGKVDVPEKDENPELSQAEVKDWEDMFREGRKE